MARELGRMDLTFVEFGHWDSLRKGLLAGERLAADLTRMDEAYLLANTRELELTKHVSLAEYMPLALLALRTAGTCTITLPEWLFDLDFPGHYRRRLASVAVSIPAVAGPWSGVHATLTLTANAMRALPDTGPAYGNPLVPGAETTRFVVNPVTTTTIATSSGQNDTGVFDLNFGDDRFLPFEGAGAVSTWTMTLRGEGNAFDRTTVSDVILHVRYRAALGTPALAAQAEANLAAVLPANGTRMFALRHEFATAWNRFLRPPSGEDQELQFTLDRAHLPFYVRARTVRVTAVDLFVDRPAGGNLEWRMRPPGSAVDLTGQAVVDAAFGGLCHGQTAVANLAATGAWLLGVRPQGAVDWNSLQPEELRDIYVVITFTTS